MLPLSGRLSVALRVAIAFILLAEGIITLANAIAAPEDLDVVVFASAEILGALFFIWSRTVRVGACFLICAFAAAAAVHALGGEFPSEHLVYALSVFFVAIHTTSSQTRHEAAA